MTELLPILGGFVLGALQHRRTLRFSVDMIGAALLGVGAAFVSGELRVSWAFALVDIAIVALSAATYRVCIRAPLQAGRFGLRWKTSRLL
jgi:hypothetical protein